MAAKPGKADVAPRWTSADVELRVIRVSLLGKKKKNLFFREINPVIVGSKVVKKINK